MHTRNLGVSVIREEGLFFLPWFIIFNEIISKIQNRKIMDYHENHDNNA